MIQKVTYGVFNKNLLSVYKQRLDNVSNPIINNSTGQTELTTGIPKSYISFKGVEEKKNVKLTSDGNELLNRAKEVAKGYGHVEVTPYHVIQAAILEVEENGLFDLSNEQTDELLEEVSPEVFIEELKGAELDEFQDFVDIDLTKEENLPTLIRVINSFYKNNIMLSSDDYDYFVDSTLDLKEENEKVLQKLPVSENVDFNDIKISSELEDNLRSLNIPAVEAYSLLGTSFNQLTTSGVDYPNDYLKNFISISLFKTSDEINGNYLQAYDKKAVDVWHKLALGSNLFVTAKNTDELSRLASSIVNTIDESMYGNFNSENTHIYYIQDDAEPAALINEVSSIKDGIPDKKHVFIINLDSLLGKMLVPNANGEFEYTPETFVLASLPKGNTKFILLQNVDSNYQLMINPIVKNSFDNFITHNIPPMHSYEATELFKSTPEILKSVEKPFTSDALEKAVLLADNIEGGYPEKAINLMNRIVNYYGDNLEKITLNEVENFALVAGDILNNKTKESSIIYDTGKNLQTYYGKETTKKDIEILVKQIKTGQVGTKGIIITSKDEEAGSGKKYTAEVVAGEAKVPFLELSSSDFASTVDEVNYAGRVPAAENMKKMFGEIKAAAKQNQYNTAVMYINNFEDFAFSETYNVSYKKAMAQLTKEMEKAEKEGLNILVMGGTTLFLSDFIPYYVKNFSENIIVDTPAFNKNARREVITKLLEGKNIPLACKSEAEKASFIEKIVKISEYSSFVEIKKLLNKTAQIMLERNKKEATIGDFIEAYLQIATGRTSRPEMPMYNKKATTSHECGHATNLEVMNNIYRKKGKPWYTSRDVNFITLDPRGNFLGAVFEGKSENMDYPFEAMFSDIVCAYGGHSCEKAFFDMDGSSGISQDLAQATSAAKRAVEYFGLGYYTGKISNAAKIMSPTYNENVYKDIEVILANAQIVSDLITEYYKDFNIWFTDKYSKLIGTDDCMIDGDDFRTQLNKWIASRSQDFKEDLNIVEDIILDVIKSTKNGKIYSQARRIIK